MITVVVYINDRPVLARSARNHGEQDSKGRYKYHVDDGTIIRHQQADGAARLAIEMLKTIKEP